MWDDLGVAVAAFLGLFVRDKRYWLGVVLAPCIFLALAGLNHLKHSMDILRRTMSGG
jgi:hypothetical protein